MQATSRTDENLATLLRTGQLISYLRVSTDKPRQTGTLPSGNANEFGQLATTYRVGRLMAEGRTCLNAKISGVSPVSNNQGIGSTSALSQSTEPM
jgi:hypothetical protein